jgi:aspartyl-tRNA(Asn)/glutamyl-tRNA(Gln) amidotransferase subunit C
MTKEEILHLARLSRVRLTNEEAEHFQAEISSILAYVGTVSSIAAEGEGAPVAGTHRNIFRPDEITNEPEAFTESILAEAPQRQGRFLAVKKILQLEE